MIHECKMSGSGRNFIVHPIVKEKFRLEKLCTVTHSHTQGFGELALNPDCGTSRCVPCGVMTKHMALLNYPFYLFLSVLGFLLCGAFSSCGAPASCCAGTL